METWNKDKPGVPIRVWASRVDKESHKRLERLARNPVLAGPLAVMPDVHASGAVCVGTVLVTETKFSAMPLAKTWVAGWLCAN